MTDTATQSAPDAQDMFPDKLPDAEDMFPERSVFSSQGRNYAAVHDAILSSPLNAPGRTLDAFGYGFKQDWGAGEATHQQAYSEADEWLRKSGMWNDYSKGQRSIIKSANEVIMRPAVSALTSVLPLFQSIVGGAFHGGQEAIAHAGEEAGAPNLGRELAAIPEAFPAGLHQTAGIPPVAEIPHAVAEARSLDVIGSGEGGYFGTAPVEAEAPQVSAEAAKTQVAAEPEQLPEQAAGTAPSPVAQPAPTDLLRFFHGGNEPTAGGPRWLTPSEDYARNFRAMGTPNQVHFVDIPKEEAIAHGGFDEINGFPRNFEAPEDIAKQLQPLEPTGEPSAPDIHAVARQIAPETFSEFDALAQKKDTFRRWIDELRQVRDENAQTNAPHQAEIADLQGKMEDATPRLAKKYQARLDPLIAERDQYIADQTARDSADMAKVRQQLMQTDYRMRDLAPDVSKAYREAQAQMPQAETAPQEVAANEETAPANAGEATPVAGESAPEAGRVVPVGAQTEAPKEVAPAAETEASANVAPRPDVRALPIAHAPSIVADVSQKLKAAGRPAEEADAAAQIVAAYWETRAQRFEGAKGTAAEMYALAAPEVRLGKSKEKQPTREMELAQTATRQGRIRLPNFPYLGEGDKSVITLLKNSDASTFIHETGHEWLGRMLDDARDPDAPQALKTDAQTVLKWLGAEDADSVKTRDHEKFARGFETYMMEGRAPSQGLARVFAKFRDWLTTIYKTVSALKSPISDDIRGVFDRLLAEKPEKTVIAPEREAGPSLAEHHEALAESTPAERAFEVANNVETERDSHAVANQVHLNNGRLEGARTEAGGNAPGGEKPPGDANASEPNGSGAEASGGNGEVGESRSEASPQGNRARQGSIGLKTHPTPLLNFLAAQGGIKSSDALISDLRQSLGGQNRLIPGFGQLIRTPKQLSSAAAKSGRLEAMSIDRAREAAIEAGFVPQGTTVAQFLEAIDDEVRGTGRTREIDAGEQAHQEHSFLEGLNDKIKEAGGSELTDAERARALELYNKEGLHDPAAIIERLALEADDHEIAGGAPERAPGVSGWDEPAPGWDTFDDRPDASGPQLSAEGSQPIEPRGATARTGREAEKLDATTDLPRSETQLIDKAGNIRLDNLGTCEDVNAVIRATAQELEPYNEAITRGRISDAEVLKLADALGMTPEKIADRQLGQAFNAEQIVAARKLLIQSAGNVRDFAAKIAGGTEADVVAYAEARARHLMIQEQVSGITAEAGRALRAFRSLAGSKEAADISAFLKNTQGKTLYQIKEEGALLAMMDTPQQVSKAVHEANLTTWQKTRSGILSWFINNLISGPITHAGYSVGNTVVQLFKATVDTTAAAAMGALRDAPAGERVYMGEVGAQLYGMIRGMRDGYSPALTALKTGVPFMKGDVEGLIGQIEAAHRPQAIPGQVGYIIETPSRAVTAIHTMHYSMNYEAEIARRAYRSAVGDGLEPGSNAFNARVADFTQNPPAKEMEAAHDEAMKMVLMKKTQFGTAQYHLQKAVNSNILAKIVMPFMQVGANILHESFIERTPVGAMSQTVRDNLMGKNGAVARDTQASRIAVGIGLSTAVIGLTAEGIMTGGGPSDPKQLAIKEMTGWKPYSIRIGEFYVPYRKYLGGLGPLIAGTADMYEVGHTLNEEGLTKAAASSLFGFAEVIADESWAKGLSNFIDAARHWDRDGGRYLRNLAADFIPFSVGLSQVTNLTDPYRREVRSMLDTARAHIPGLSRGLYPVRDIWGEPIESHTALGPSRANSDPATKALLDAGYFPGRLERKIRGVELSAQQYDDFTRLAGRMSKMRMNALVNTPGFTQMPKQFQVEKIKDIIGNARESARSMILMQNPDIITKASQVKRSKVTGETIH